MSMSMSMGDVTPYETTSSTADLLMDDDPPWGTLEELLLVCAVNRHGPDNWPSVASELHQRLLLHSQISPDLCRLKYVLLRRRFSTVHAHADEPSRMVEELRKLRVQQLQRQLLQHDLSILSLQKKVKVLEEEREKNNSSATSSSLLKPDTDGHEPIPGPVDLRIEPENANKTEEPENSPEKRRDGDSAEDRSVNESNSSKAENTGVEADAKREPEVGGEDPVERKEGGPGESASESKRDNSINNDNTTTNNNDNNTTKNNITSTKIQQQQQEQSSDVQSSASLTKKKRRRFRVGGGIVNSSGDEVEAEAEAEEMSPANKKMSIKSQPLIRFLDFLLSHKHASAFLRRLPSQETEKFRNVVRHHMDLDMVQSRLDRGIYSDCPPKFYRDLLLIFTNAVLFYRKSSAEHIAAREMRKLVLDEITIRTPKPKILSSKPDPDFQHLEPVVKKPRSSTTMVVCRRRSSIQGLSDGMKKDESHHVSGSLKNNTTTTTTTTNNNNNNNKVGSESEEKAKGDQHQKKADGSSSSNINAFSSRKEKGVDEGDGVSNSSKRSLTKERSSSLGRGTLRLSNNNSKKIVSKDGTSKREKTGNVGDNKEGCSKGGEGDEPTEKRKVNVDQKPEKATTTVLKKQGVANFLKRIKQNSPSSQEKTKNIGSDDEEEGDDDEKKAIERKEKTDSSGRKTGGNARKVGNASKEVDVVVTRRTSGRKGEKEAAVSSRATGRPPKRKAAMMGSGTPDSGKRRKSGGGDEENVRKKPRR